MKLKIRIKQNNLKSKAISLKHCMWILRNIFQAEIRLLLTSLDVLMTTVLGLLASNSSKNGRPR